MEELMSTGERKQRIIADIIQDFSLKPRLNNDRGTAILVAASIYDACHYFRLFQNTSFGQYCGVITSYEPNHNAISREPANSDERYKFDTYTQHVLKGKQTTKQYEDEAKRRFIEEPANCNLLIVVSKLLTGFDAPSCTYIYLDNEVRDHTLFQAICRTNRLDGDDKPYGHIIDYKELIEQVQNSVAVYNSDELDTDEHGDDGNVVLKDWRTEGKKKLDEAREVLRYLCELVAQPRELEQYLQYFCGDANDPNALNTTEPLRISFYKATATFLRAYAEIAGNLAEAGYSAPEISSLEKETQFYADTWAAIKKYSGEELDIKPYEADMRHLLNTYIQADPAAELGSLSQLPLTEMIIETGIHDAIARKLNAKGQLSRRAVAEGIINNVRKTIIRDQLTDPKFYEEMSKLFADLIKRQRDDAEGYEQFLKDTEALVMRLAKKQPTANIPAVLHGKAEAIVLFNNLNSIATTTFHCPADDEEKARLALELDQAMRERAPAGWKGDDTREKQVLVVSPANAERTALNTAIRTALQERGQVPETGLTHPVLINRSVTGAERGWARSYAINDVVRYRTGSKKFDIVPGSYARVTAVDPERNQLTVRTDSGATHTYSPTKLHGVEVYREETREFAVGDRIQFRAPLKAQQIPNGALGTIAALDQDSGQVSIALDAGPSFSTAFADCGTSSMAMPRRVIVVRAPRLIGCW